VIGCIPLILERGAEEKETRSSICVVGAIASVVRWDVKQWGGKGVCLVQMINSTPASGRYAHGD
jgi:hypothetical protein